MTVNAIASREYDGKRVASISAKISGEEMTAEDLRRGLESLLKTRFPKPFYTIWSNIIETK